jgi:acetate---CoA ligase (ADP-forming)
VTAQSQAPANAALTALLEPRSIALAGVSARKGSVGRQALRTLRRFGFAGEVAIIHPRETEIDETPAYRGFADVPHGIDLVMIFTAAADVPSVLAQAADAGAAAAIVFSAGFGESTNAELDAEIRQIAGRTGIRVLGPNCQGVINTRSGAAASFTNAASAPDLGAIAPIGYVGQSGAIGGSVFDLLRERGLRPAFWASTGNQLDIDVTEVASWVVREGVARFLVLYIEQIPPARQWEALCAAARDAGVTLALLRSGLSDAGRAAIASHTGSLVPSDKAFELIGERYGVIPVASVEATVALASAWSCHPPGVRLGIVTTSGGAGGIAADLAEAYGLRTGRLSERTRERLGDVLPGFAAVGNPVDVTAQLLLSDPEAFRDVCRLVARDPGVDHLVVIMTVVVGVIAERFAAAVSALRAEDGISVSVVYIASHDRTQVTRAALAAAGVAVFDDIQAMVQALGAITRVTGPGREAEPAPPAAHADDQDVEVVTEWAGQQLLDSFGIDRPPGLLATSAAEAERLAAHLGDGLVMKVQSAQLLHKSEAGAVRVGVAPGAAAAAYGELVAAARQYAPGAVIDGVLVQRMAQPGIELLVGVQGPRDGYPPVITVGAGGLAVEIFADVATAIAPLDEATALTLLRRLKVWPLLAGYRGHAGADLGHVARAIARIGDLAVSVGDRLIDLEINPLIVHESGSGADAVDFLARLRPATGVAAGD